MYQTRYGQSIEEKLYADMAKEKKRIEEKEKELDLNDESIIVLTSLTWIQVKLMRALLELGKTQKVL